MIGNVDLQNLGPLQRDLIKAHLASPIRVTEERVRAALELLDVIDDATSQPVMFIALDGELAFMWEQADKCTVLVPQTDGRLRYSSQFGEDKSADCVPFIYPKLPDVVRDMLREFVRRDA